MVLSRHLVLGTPGLMGTSLDWTSPKVRRTLTCTIYLLGEPLILVLYVDDLFLTGSERLIGLCKEDLALEFEMKDIGLI